MRGGVSDRGQEPTGSRRWGVDDLGRRSEVRRQRAEGIYRSQMSRRGK